MKIELKITDKIGNIQSYDVTGSPHLHCVLNPHYDNKGRLNGGIVISEGKITGHIDPCGEEGYPGPLGIDKYFENLKK